MGVRVVEVCCSGFVVVVVVVVVVVGLVSDVCVCVSV